MGNADPSVLSIKPNRFKISFEKSPGSGRIIPFHSRLVRPAYASQRTKQKKFIVKSSVKVVNFVCQAAKGVLESIVRVYRPLTTLTTLEESLDCQDHAFE